MIVPRRHAAILSLFACLASFTGCDTKNNAPKPNPTVTKVPERIQAGAKVTLAEAKEFAARLADAMNTTDQQAVLNLVDFRAMVEIATENLGLTDAQREPLIIWALQGFTAPTGFLSQTFKNIEGGSQFGLLRVHEKNGEIRALYRVAFGADVGLAYQDYILARRPDGQVRAVDIDIYFSGERLSQTLRRMLIPLAAHQNRSVLARLSGEENDLVKHMPKLRQMVELTNSGRNTEAMAIYDALPESLKKDKTVMLNRLRATQPLDDAAYALALDEYIALFPGDPSIDLQAIDANVMKKKYDDAIRSVDRVDSALGGDPFLDSIRSNIKQLAGDSQAAAALLEKAIAADPEQVEYYWQRIGLALELKDFDAVLKYLNLMDERFEVEFSDLEQIAEYAGFVKSPQYQEWLKAHPKP